MNTIRLLFEHAATPWFALTLTLFAAQYLVRRFLPQLWERAADLPFGDSAERTKTVAVARKAWQALPSILGGAIVVALVSHADVRLAALGALSGVGAPVLHEVMKWMPWIPYDGARSSAIAAVVAKRIGGASVVLLGVLLPGCAPSRSPADEKSEDICLAKVFAETQASIAVRCDTPTFGECPQHDAIMSQWEQEARACQR